MTTRTHTVVKKNPKNNQEWSWEETPEVLAAIEQLHKSSKQLEVGQKVVHSMKDYLLAQLSTLTHLKS